MNSRNPIAFFSHYAREDSKLSLSRQMHQELGYDIWDIPGVKGLYIGDGKIVVATAEDHPSQGNIPTEIKRPDYKGTPVSVEYHGYSYHLTGHLDHPDDAKDDSYNLAYQGKRGGGGGGTVQGGSQIVCGQEYGTCGGVFVDNALKQYLTDSWHVIKGCKGSVQIGSGNKNAPEARGSVATVGKSGCGCGGAAQTGATSKGWSEIGTYGLGTIAGYDYALAYPAVFGRSINSIPYLGRRPLDHHYFQKGGGGSRGGGGRSGGKGGGTFYIDGAACPLTGKGNESILGLGMPKGYRRAVMGEKLTYKGVRQQKTFPVTGLNYTDRGGICGTCTDMVVMYPCPLPGDSGASYWGTDGFLVAIVTDGSNDKGGNNCTGYNCSIIHNEECFGIHVRNAQTPVGGPAPGPLTPIARVPAPPGGIVTAAPLDPGAVEAQKKRIQSYFGATIAVA